MRAEYTFMFTRNIYQNRPYLGYENTLHKCMPTSIKNTSIAELYLENSTILRKLNNTLINSWVKEGFPKDVRKCFVENKVKI